MTRRSCSTSRPKKSSSSRCAVAALLFLGAAPALAAGEDFAPHVQKAQGCYDAKDFDCAVRELLAAYQIKPVPGLLLNIGHAHLDANRPQEALTFYTLYLNSEKRLTPAIRAEVEAFREQARQKLRDAAAQPAPTPPPAAQAEAPPPAVPPTPVETPPPAVTPPSPAPPVAPSPPPPEAGAPSRPPAGGLALIGVGAGLLIIGLGLGGGAVATAGQVTAGPGPFDADLDGRGRSLSYAGAALDVIGGLALVGGIGWTAAWAAHRKKEKAPTAVSIRPALTPALVSGRF